MPSSLSELARAELQGGERILATLPFVSVPKKPRGPEGKIRFGIWQSWKRYRPIIVTDRRLLVFDTGRTPNPRTLLAAFPRGDVTMSEVSTGRFGTMHFSLDLPGEGEVPFEAGRRDDVAALRASVGVMARS
jgi:hypothetical protein